MITGKLGVETMCGGTTNLITTVLMVALRPANYLLENAVISLEPGKRHWTLLIVKTLADFPVAHPKLECHLSMYLLTLYQMMKRLETVTSVLLTSRH